ncbi:sulfite exporter TauE/SafE family protein, partial [Saccharomonospora saliphila]|uniref:sulfite exporter TauE/SafE family protein n=1 Tax=Saccharomonospora saliphila TaxID=369829 RepID=UPI0012F969A4
MIWWHAVLIAVAGVWAGMINTVVGSGTLVTFPVLVALGYPPVTATTSNAIGLAPGSISGAVGYRHELKGQWRRLLLFAPASLVGAIGGTILLLSLPPDAFETVVPFLVGLAVVLVLVQPRVATWVLSRRERRGRTARDPAGSGAGAVEGTGSAAT